jgi:uncharacterized protein YbcI
VSEPPEGAPRDRQARPGGGELVRAISNAMVALHRRHYGRGPAAARSYLFDGMVLCVLSDVYTHVEKTLLEAGQAERVRETRLLHQVAMEDEYRATVEEVTGRRVAGFVSTVGFDPDVAVELFFLEPDPASAANDGA